MHAHHVTASLQGDDHRTTHRRGVAVRVLESIAERARAVLKDPGKRKWHKEESELLERVERELDRLRGD